MKDSTHPLRFKVDEVKTHLRRAHAILVGTIGLHVEGEDATRLVQRARDIVTSCDKIADATRSVSNIFVPADESSR